MVHPRVAPAIRTIRVHEGCPTGRCFRAPYGVAADVAGRVIVGDVQNGRVHVLDADGSPLHAWGNGVGPFAVATGPDDLVWVADTTAGRVSGFTRRGRAVARLGAPGTFRRPAGIAAAPDGRVAVSDAGNGRVMVFAADGSLEQELGTGGLLDKPVGVAFDAAGQLVVVDRARKHLVRFGAEPDYPDVMDLGLLPGVPAAPWGVAIDAAGRMLVSVTDIHRLLLLAPDGQFLGAWGAEADGHGSLLHPTALALSPAGNLLVADTYNNRIIEAGIVA